MKFALTFKTPDVLDQILERYMNAPNEHFPCDHEGFKEDCDKCISTEEDCCNKIAEIKACADKFLMYGECITIEFDTETNSAKAIEQG